MDKKSDLEKGHKEVIEFLDSLTHPLKSEIEEVRKIIMNVNPDLTEHIKWKAPSFCLNGDDRITFNLHGKEFFRLIFHCGSKVVNKNIKGVLAEDTTDIMEWASHDRAIIKFTNMEDIQKKSEKLVLITKKWLELAK